MAFDFIDVLEALPGTLVTSDPVTVSGLTLGTKTATMVGIGELQVDGGVWATSGVVQNGSSLALRVTTPAGTSGESTNVSVNIQSLGYVTWVVTNKDNMVREFGTGSDASIAFQVTPAQPVAEVMEGFDTLLPDHPYVMVMDSASGTGDPIAITSAMSVVVSEVAIGEDVVGAFMTVTIADVGTGTDSLSLAVSALIREAGIGTETVLHTVTTSGLVSEQAKGTDGITGRTSRTVVENGTGYDTLVLTPVSFLQIDEVGSGSDAVDVMVRLQNLVREAGAGHDSLIPHTLISAMVSEHGAGYDQLIYPNVDRMAHVFTAKLAAYSSWQQLEVSEVFSLNGVVYGLAPDGLYILLDDAAAGEIYTGLLSLGSKNRKRVPAVYVTAAAADPMKVAVTPVSQGSATFEYEARPNSQETPVTTRVTLGKGMRSTYFGVALGNTGTGKTQIGEVLFVVSETDRRI